MSSHGFLKRLRSDGVLLTHLDAAGTKDNQMLTNMIPQAAVTMHGVRVLSSCYWCERHGEERARRAGGPLTREALLHMRRGILCWLFGVSLPTGLYM